MDHRVKPGGDESARNSHALLTFSGLPCDDRVRLTDRLAFVAKPLQSFVGDFGPKLLQLRCRRLVGVSLRVT